MATSRLNIPNLSEYLRVKYKVKVNCVKVYKNTNNAYFEGDTLHLPCDPFYTWKIITEEGEKMILEGKVRGSSSKIKYFIDFATRTIERIPLRIIDVEQAEKYAKRYIWDGYGHFVLRKWYEC